MTSRSWLTHRSAARPRAEMLQHVELHVAAHGAAIAPQCGKRAQAGQGGRERHVAPAFAAAARRYRLDVVVPWIRALHDHEIAGRGRNGCDPAHKPFKKVRPRSAPRVGRDRGGGAGFNTTRPEPDAPVEPRAAAAHMRG